MTVSEIANSKLRSSHTTLPMIDVPDKSIRPRAFDYKSDRYQWRFGRIPEFYQRGGSSELNPLRECGVFVVHGIGDQDDTDTAVAMRRGIEESIALVELEKWDPSDKDAWILPAPYVYDGYWAKYDDLETFKDDLSDDLSVLTVRQRHFFSSAWSDRTKSWSRCFKWLFNQGRKLVGRADTIGKRVVYFALTLLLLLVFVVAAIKSSTRQFLVTYVNDARLYFEPKGDFEFEMVQLIDRRVGRAFLKMIGLDWEFNKLEDYEKLVINGRPKAFESVVWVAHSLGTVISFNVIGDILTKCAEIRDEHEQSNQLEEKVKNVRRVENSLARFFTIGSPLDKICFLYMNADGSSSKNAVLRSWPERYLPGGSHDLSANVSAEGDDRWWLNIFYGSDPISGSLEMVEQFLGIQNDSKLISNASTRRWRLPLVSHIGYWKDTGFVTKMLELTYPGFTKEVVYSSKKKGKAANEGQHHVRIWNKKYHGTLSAVGLVVMAFGVPALLVLLHIYRKSLVEFFKFIF